MGLVGASELVIYDEDAAKATRTETVLCISPCLAYVVNAAQWQNCTSDDDVVHSYCLVTRSG